MGHAEARGASLPVRIGYKLRRYYFANRAEDSAYVEVQPEQSWYASRRDCSCSAYRTGSPRDNAFSQVRVVLRCGRRFRSSGGNSRVSSREFPSNHGHVVWQPEKSSQEFPPCLTRQSKQV